LICDIQEVSITFRRAKLKSFFTKGVPAMARLRRVHQNVIEKRRALLPNIFSLSFVLMFDIIISSRKNAMKVKIKEI
ncbi:MAG: hypothetical protein ACE5KJ_07690, partial [Candidatus Zixiibacteriota bacterium]